MAVSDKIKGILKASGKTHAGLAEALGISRQSLSNKFYRDSFNTADLINIAKYTDCKILFLLEDGSQIVLDEMDIN